MSLTNSEKLYIEEKTAKWEHGRIRYWESLPALNPDNPSSERNVAESRQKPALLFIHGYGAMLEHWRRTFAGLKGRYRLYALDLLGMGLSEKPNGSQVKYSAKLWAQEVYDFLKYKDEKQVIIVGHSMGGMVALQVAMLHLEMVAGLVLVDSAGLPDQGQAEQEAASSNSRYRRQALFSNLTYGMIKTPVVGEMMAAVMTFPNEWTVRRYLQGAYYNKSKITPQLVHQFMEPLESPGAAGSYLAITRSFADFQLPLQPGMIKGPVLIIWGEYDRMMPPDNMLPRWKHLLPQAELYRVADSAHCPMDERPDLFNPRLIQFVEQVSAGTWKAEDETPNPKEASA
ncbi:MAG TPA: alpha/beta hydrolase [Chloroflexia bacterium]|nr:alpha/beta hydrolase [Chloroflexia bacterium]